MDWRLWKRAKERLSSANRISSQGYSHDWVGHGYDRRCRLCYEREDGSLCRGRPAPIMIDHGSQPREAR